MTNQPSDLSPRLLNALKCEAHLCIEVQSEDELAHFVPLAAAFFGSSTFICRFECLEGSIALCAEHGVELISDWVESSATPAQLSKRWTAVVSADTALTGLLDFSAFVTSANDAIADLESMQQALVVELPRGVLVRTSWLETYLSATQRGREKAQIGVIVLSYSASKREYEMTTQCLASLAQTIGACVLDIVVVESANSDDLAAYIGGRAFEHKCRVVHLSGPFNYNRAVRMGLAAFGNDRLDAILISNNDVVYDRSCLMCLMQHLAHFDSVSPWCPKYHDRFFAPVTTALPGYRTSLEVCGWAIMFRASLLTALPAVSLFPDDLSFWFQDNYYAWRLEQAGLQHALVPSAKAEHLFQQSHGLLSKRLLRRGTIGAYEAFRLLTSEDASPELTVCFAGLLGSGDSLLEIAERIHGLSLEPFVEVIAVLRNGRRSIVDEVADLLHMSRGKSVLILRVPQGLDNQVISRTLERFRECTAEGERLLVHDEGGQLLGVCLPRAAVANKLKSEGDVYEYLESLLWKGMGDNCRADEGACKLSILIPSIPKRCKALTERLLPSLLQQSGSSATEVVVLLDNQTRSIGSKRNNLLMVADGMYSVFVDDDDDVSPTYVQDLLGAIESHSECDCIVFDAWVTVNGDRGKRCIYGVELEDHDTPDAYHRRPNHICCFRSDLAALVLFPDTNWQEDFAWASAMHPRIRSQVRIPKILYFYNYVPAKSAAGPQSQNDRRRMVAAATLNPGNTSVVAFLHVAQMGNWEEVLTDQWGKLNLSGLLERLDSLVIGVVGRGPERLPFAHPKVRCLHLADDVRAAEFPTLALLREHCRINDGSVVYLHTKGVSQGSSFSRDWRHLMEHFCIAHWRECLGALETHDLAGVNWLNKPWPHFSGNFWWAKNEYVRTLPALQEVETYDRREAERWIGRNEAARVACLHSSAINHYEEAYPRSRYSSIHEVDPVRLRPHDSCWNSAWRGLENRFQDALDPVEPIRTIVEIGVEFGYSLFALASAVPGAVVFGVDPYEHQGVHHRRKFENSGGKAVFGTADAYKSVNARLTDFPNVRLLTMTSAEATAAFNEEIDVLHIDAVHLYAEVRQHFEEWVPKIRLGGCVLLHDTLSFPDDVGRLFDQLPNPKWNIENGCGLGVWYKRR